MAHQIHFLSRLGRASDKEVRFALSLYYDAEFTREIVSQFEWLNYKDKSDGRLAIALSGGDRSSHVILERDGSFVTCLGPGMKIGGIPVITQNHFEKLKRGRAFFRNRYDELSRMMQDDSLFGSGKRTMLNWSRNMPREEFKKWSLFQPLMLGQIAKLMELSSIKGLEIDLKLQRTARKGKIRTSRERKNYYKYWKTRWDTAHLILIFSSDLIPLERLVEKDEWEDFIKLGSNCLLENTLPLSLMGLWAIGRLGIHLFPFVKKEYVNAEDLDKFLDAAFMLFAIAVRHKRYRREVIKLLKRPFEEEEVPEVITDFCNRMQGELVLCLENQEKYDDMLKKFVEANFEKEYNQHSVVPLTREIPPDLKIPFMARIERPFLNVKTNALHEAVLFMSWAIKRKPEELFIPGEYKELFYPYKVEQAMKMHSSGLIADIGPGILKDKTKPGRNAPCLCGSGKKYKKCCLKKK